MNKKNIFVIYFALTFFLFINAYAQDQNKSECRSLTEQITGAIIADDWMSQEKYCLLYIKQCIDIVGKESIAENYATLAGAYIEMSEYSKGLDAANKGIDLYYFDPMNHMYKARILSLLKDKKGAIESFNRAEKLAAYRKEQLEIELIAAPKKVHKELLESTIGLLQLKIKQCEAIIAYCNRFRKLV